MLKKTLIYKISKINFLITLKLKASLRLMKIKKTLKKTLEKLMMLKELAKISSYRLNGLSPTIVEACIAI